MQREAMQRLAVAEVLSVMASLRDVTLQYVQGRVKYMVLKCKKTVITKYYSTRLAKL